jgi:stage V sporulation protein B
MIAKFLGIFFKSPLNGIIGEYGLGLYSYAYPLYGAFISISTIGLPVAVSKLVSEYAASGNYKTAYKVYRTAVFTLGILGLLSTIVMFSCANFFISVFQWDPDAYYSIIAISVAPFFVALTSAYRGIFQGMQAMTYSAVSQIVDQMVRVGVGLALAIYLTNSFGIPEGAAGATFGATAGAAAAFLFLSISFSFFKNKQKPLVKSSEHMQTTAYKTILKSLIIIAIPVAFSGLVATIMELINTATIPACLIKAGVEDPTALLGILEQKAQTLVNVPLVIGTALSASLVPTISQSLKLNRPKEAVKKTSMAVRAAFLISVPSAIGLSVLSEPIIELLFRNSTPIAYTMLSILEYIVIF